MSHTLTAAASHHSDHYAAKQHWSRKLLGEARRRKRPSATHPFSPEWNVVGVGVGEKWSDGASTGQPSIKFLVRKKVPKTKLKRAHRIPSHCDGLLTDVEEVGRVRFLSSNSDDPTQPHDPVQPGYSIGYKSPDGLRNAGTLGAIVTDAAGQRYLLSACHVLADLSSASANLDVTQPGTLDQTNARVVGNFLRGSAPLVGVDNRVDAAIATIAPGISVDPKILGIGPITGISNAFASMVVDKVGRRSRYTAGYVFHTGFDISGPVPGGEAKFVNQLAILGLNGLFADDGDSGSLVLERVTNNAVGLLFLQAGQYSFASHVSEVLQALQVSLL